jgi:hypothetical protein
LICVHRLHADYSLRFWWCKTLTPQTEYSHIFL